MGAGHRQRGRMRTSVCRHSQQYIHQISEITSAALSLQTTSIPPTLSLNTFNARNMKLVVASLFIALAALTMAKEMNSAPSGIARESRSLDSGSNLHTSAKYVLNCPWVGGSNCIRNCQCTPKGNVWCNKPHIQDWCLRCYCR